jgi:hypothetical protein
MYAFPVHFANKKKKECRKNPAPLQAGSSPPTAAGYPRNSLTTDATTQPMVPELVLTSIQSGPVCDEYRRSISTRSFWRTAVFGMTRDSIE